MKESIERERYKIDYYSTFNQKINIIYYKKPQKKTHIEEGNKNLLQLFQV